MMKGRQSCIRILLAGIVALGLAAVNLRAQELFSKLVGEVKVGEVAAGGVLEVPFILWGGDVATFHANGGLATKPGTIFDRHGLNLKLTAGDNFPEQVKAYLSGRTPFLRGTFSMLGQASEVLNADPRTRPVVFLQLTWSAGDHMVSRAGLRKLNDLKPEGGKKKKVALQKFGPHAGMFDDVLRSTKVGWDEVEVIWTDDVTGPKGPAELFKKDGTIDACFAITPDMVALTGGLEKIGTGRDGTVKDSHVLVSTASLSRSIADVYACRKDFYDAHREVVEKFVAGYLKACEELLDIKKRASKKEKDALAQYKTILDMTKGIYGKEAVPDDEAADGLISDATFVGLPGNVGFFLDPKNQSGFKNRQEAAMSLAMTLHNAKAPSEFLKPDFGDYSRIKSLGGAKSVTEISNVVEPRFKDVKLEDIRPEDAIVDFTIGFEPNEAVFEQEQYGPTFDRALKQSSTFGNAVMVVRGHADVSKVLNDFVKAGLESGHLKRLGNPGKFQYFLDGNELDLKNTKQVIEAIQKTDFAESKRAITALQQLSQQRAETVKKAILSFAERNNIRVDESQIKPEGVGILEPVVTQPRTVEDMAKNRRVEFRLSKVPVEKIGTSDLIY